MHEVEDRLAAGVTTPRPFWVGGEAATGEDTLTVHHPYDGRVVATVSVPTPSQVETAVAAADAVRHDGPALPAHVRAGALRHVCDQLRVRADEFAHVITSESGKPLRWARVEVARAASTFELAAEEARRWSGELQRLDTDVTGEGRLALVRRVPRGPVLGIAPFNFPLNLMAHKVAPALALGAPIIMKPAPATPLSALLLGDLLAETGLPDGMWSVLPVRNESMPALVADPRLPVVSFTGSVPVGWQIRDAVPRKHVTLELGGNAAAVVCADWSSPEDLAYAAERVAVFGTYQAGQACVAVQRVFVDRSVYASFVELLAAAVRARVTGDPWDELTEVGPLINASAAERVEQWVREAVQAGATLITGGRRDGAAYEPTVLTGVPRDARLAVDEVFGPVIIVDPVDDLDEAVRAVNASRFGLQAGVFTHRLEDAFRAHRDLDVGGVVIGDVPTYRADQAPYGGVKDSGTGREGVRAAMQDLSEDRVLILTGVAV